MTIPVTEVTANTFNKSPSAKLSRNLSNVVTRNNTDNITPQSKINIKYKTTCNSAFNILAFILIHSYYGLYNTLFPSVKTAAFPSMILCKTAISKSSVGVFFPISLPK